MTAPYSAWWHRFREQLHFFIIAPLVIILLTFPTARYIVDASVFWLPTQVFDVWISITDAWFFELFLVGESDFFFTDLLFHPHGVSLDYRNLGLIHMFVFNALRAVLPVSSAYNLTYLLIIFVTTAAAYIYLRYLLKDKWIGLFGALVFGCSIYVVARPSQPLISLIATLPLSLYFTQRSLLERRWSFALWAGLAAGITIFVIPYTYVILAMLMALFCMYFAAERWRQRDFWLRILLIAVIAGLIGAIRITPLIRDSADMAHALTKQSGVEFHTDLALHFINTDHPLLTPLFSQLLGINLDPRWNSSYFGYTALLLSAFALYRCRCRKLLFWLALALPFLLLRLGSFLTINGQEFRHIVLPKAWLNDLLPAVFQAMYSPDYFYCAALMSLAVLSSVGLRELLRPLPWRWARISLLGCICLVAFENYTELDPMILPEEQTTFLDWLAEEPDQDRIHLINLPMGRVPSKLYDYYLMRSGYPHAEGTAGRTPDAAYAYIRDNFLLNAWREERVAQCRLANETEYLAALEQLSRDGFSHVILHDTLWNAAAVADSFAFAKPAYADAFGAVYRIFDLRQSCPATLPSHEYARHLNAFFQLADRVPRRNELILSLHPDQALDPALFNLYASEAEAWKSLVHLSGGASQARIQSSLHSVTGLGEIASDSSIIWLLHNPAQTALSAMPDFNRWLESQYTRCGMAHSGENLVAARYIDARFDCAMIDADATLSARYDSGIVLANARWRLHDEALRIDLWFSEPGNHDYAFTLQVFNAAGDKVAQADHHIGDDPLWALAFDVAGWEAGEYAAKLIVYHRETGESQAGAVLLDGPRFERELAIARFEIAG